MKKIFTLATAVLFAAVSMAFAQPRGYGHNDGDGQRATPEERAERMARGMAEQLALSDDAAAKFIPVYKAFHMEQMAINKEYRPERKAEGESYSDAEVDAMIRKDFEKSQKILDLRKAYYEKFLGVISPKQIRAMYQKEKEFGFGGGHGMRGGHGAPQQGHKGGRR